MKKMLEWPVGLVVAGSFCFLFGVWGSPVQAAAFSQQRAQPPAVASDLRCYATRSDPGAVVCYRVSGKAEYRHGQVVYIPRLIQVPVPSNPPPVVVVSTLDDIHPGSA